MDGGNSVCWDMVQDNYFFPGVPRTLWQNRTSVKPMIIGTNKDEWAGWVFTDLNEQNGQLSTFTKNYVETQLISRYSNFLGDQASVALKLFESLYLDPQTSDDDHMAWLKFMVNILRDQSPMAKHLSEANDARSDNDLLLLPFLIILAFESQHSPRPLGI
uniref:Carboxylesterase type B domain-containing protein n=1 Tax=Acrobeloides nanus TaxID=290746 RepID=A0A914ED41_9BILA